MTIEKIDHQERAVSRLITQYREAANLKGYTAALVAENNDLEQVFCDLLNLRTIDTATDRDWETALS